MLKLWKIKFICILLVVGSTSGCALALIEKALGDKKATHADDQSIDGGNQGIINQ